MKTIFMTGGGGAGTIYATRKLRELGYRIILGDMNEWAAGLRFADKSYTLPSGDSDNFIEVVADIINKENVDVFIPLVDEELLKSYQLKNVKVLLPRYEFAKICLDKWELYRAFKENGLPMPVTHLGYNFRENGCDYHCVVKPRVGRGSRDVREIKNIEQYQAYKELTGLSEVIAICQQKLIGTEYTVSAVVNSYNDLIAVVPKEIIQKRGITISAVTRKVEAIEKLCYAITDKLRPCGSFNVQLIIQDGVSYVFEINPRFSTTIALTMEAGINEIELSLSDDRHTSGLLLFTEGLVMSRYYDQLFWRDK
jgi:carbamoyl-phosphate synthase large subunit